MLWEFANSSAYARVSRAAVSLDIDETASHKHSFFHSSENGYFGTTGAGCGSKSSLAKLVVENELTMSFDQVSEGEEDEPPRDERESSSRTMHRALKIFLWHSKRRRIDCRIPDTHTNKSCCTSQYGCKIDNPHQQNEHLLFSTVQCNGRPGR